MILNWGNIHVLYKMQNGHILMLHLNGKYIYYVYLETKMIHDELSFIFQNGEFIQFSACPERS